MQRVDRLGIAQRIIVVVALGLALAVTGEFITSIGSPAANFGWFGYAPLTGSILTGSTLSNWEQLLVWLALISVWTACSIYLFRPPASGDEAG